MSVKQKGITVDKLPYAKRLRLEYIEFTLYRHNGINRSHIIKKFGVSLPQASRDIRDYIKLFPKAIEYNLHNKQYEKAKGFKFNLTGDAEQPTNKGKAMTNNLLQFFTYEHLPAHLQEISKPFGELAHKLEEILPSNPEKTTTFRKLLEAKDCAVRAQLFKG